MLGVWVAEGMSEDVFRGDESGRLAGDGVVDSRSINMR
jgi:hypothetical protein